MRFRGGAPTAGKEKKLSGGAKAEGLGERVISFTCDSKGRRPRRTLIQKGGLSGLKTAERGVRTKKER